jgi:hypothetical protein
MVFDRPSPPPSVAAPPSAAARVRGSLAAAILAWTWGTPLAAADTPAGPASRAASAEHPGAPVDPRALFVEGTKLYRAGRYADALIQFRAAYQGLPSPRILFDIAACEAALHQNAAALRDYTRALQDPGGKLSKAEQTEATRVSAELSPKVGLVVVQAAGPGDVIVDGEVVGPLPLGPLFLEPKAHEVSLTKEGVKVASQSVDLHAGERVVVRLEAPGTRAGAALSGGAPVEAPPVPAPPSTLVVDLTEPPTPRPSAPATELRARGPAFALGLTALGAGTVSAGVGAALYVLAGNDYAAMLAAKDMTTFYAAKSAGRTKEAAGVGLLVGGIAATVGGAVLVTLSAGKARRLAVTLQLAPQEIGLWMRSAY